MRATVRLDEHKTSHVESLRDGEDISDAECVRRAIERSQRVEELETELQHAEARIDELENELAETRSRVETTNELVEFVEDRKSLLEKQAEREQRKENAGVVTRTKWWLTGMDDSEE